TAFQYTALIGGLPISNTPGGTASPTDLQNLFALKYGGLAGPAASAPIGAPIGFQTTTTAPTAIPIASLQTPWYSTISANALDTTNGGNGPNTTTGLNTNPLHTAFTTNFTNNVIVPGKGPAVKTMNINPVVASTANGFPAYFFPAVQKGTQLLIGRAPPATYFINSAKEGAGNVVTITTASAHSFQVGDPVVIAGVGVAGYNNTAP